MKSNEVIAPKNIPAKMSPVFFLTAVLRIKSITQIIKKIVVQVVNKARYKKNKEGIEAINAPNKIIGMTVCKFINLVMV